MISTLSVGEIIILESFNLSSVNALNFVQCKILSLNLVLYQNFRQSQIEWPCRQFNNHGEIDAFLVS